MEFAQKVLQAEPRDGGGEGRRELRKVVLDERPEAKDAALTACGRGGRGGRPRASGGSRAGPLSEPGAPEPESVGIPSKRGEEADRLVERDRLIVPALKRRRFEVAAAADGSGSGRDGRAVITVGDSTTIEPAAAAAIRKEAGRERRMSARGRPIGLNLGRALDKRLEHAKSDPAWSRE